MSTHSLQYCLQAPYLLRGRVQVSRSQKGCENSLWVVQHTPAISGLLWWASTVVKDITKECRNSHFSYQLYSQSGRICLPVLWTETWNNTQGGIWTTPLRNNLSVSAPLTWNSAPLYNGYRCDLGWARFNLQQFNLKKCRFNICTHLWQRTQLKSIWKVAKPWGEVVGYLFNSQVIQHSGSGSMLTSKVFCFCFFLQWQNVILAKSLQQTRVSGCVVQAVQDRNVGLLTQWSSKESKCCRWRTHHPCVTLKWIDIEHYKPSLVLHGRTAAKNVSFQHEKDCGLFCYLCKCSDLWPHTWEQSCLCSCVGCCSLDGGDTDLKLIETRSHHHQTHHSVCHRFF